MKYDGRACKFNMDTGCVELLLLDGRKISIDCTGVEDALDVTMTQRAELDYLIYNDPAGVCRPDSKRRAGRIFEKYGWEPWVRRLRTKYKKQGAPLNRTHPAIAIHDLTRWQQP